MRTGDETRRRVQQVLNYLLKAEYDGSTSDFANALGVPRQTLGFWLRGDRTPSAESIVNISEVSGLSTDYILGIYPFPEHAKGDAKERIGDMVNFTGLVEKELLFLNRAFDMAKTPTEYALALLEIVKQRLTNITTKEKNGKEAE